MPSGWAPVRSSAVPTSRWAQRRAIIELTRRVGGSAYLAGGGAAGYQQDELFA